MGLSVVKKLLLYDSETEVDFVVFLHNFLFQLMEDIVSSCNLFCHKFPFSKCLANIKFLGLNEFPEFHNF